MKSFGGWALCAVGSLCFGGTVKAEVGCDFTLKETLQETCLYNNSTSFMSYEPRYPLWSDGLEKRRWLYLPEGTSIDTSDSNYWVFPIGTTFFKQFSTPDGKRLETRMIQKVRARKRTKPLKKENWVYRTYAWNESQSVASLSEGAENVLGTQHDIPTQAQCVECHKGSPDRVLGVSLVQSASSSFIQSLKTRFSHEVDLSYEIPGSQLDRRVLGMFHANCGHCHNPKQSFAWPGRWQGLYFYVDVNEPTLERQPVLRTAIDEEMLYDRKEVYKYRIRSGNPEHSAVYARMNSRDDCLQMPPIGSEEIDMESVALVKQWIETLGQRRIPRKKAYRYFQEAGDYVVHNSKRIMIRLTDKDERRKVHPCPDMFK